MSLLKLAHQTIKSHIQVGDSVIDATVGNGYDTLFLAEHVGRTGRVYGFDIQQIALDKARQHLQTQAAQVTLILANHADIKNHIPTQEHGNIKAVMFNLGYLPKGDKTIITQTETTLTALTSASELLAQDGLLTVLAYSGHQGGMAETIAVEQWLKQLPNRQFKFSTLFSAIPSATAPKLFIVHKLYF